MMTFLCHLGDGVTKLVVFLIHHLEMAAFQTVALADAGGYPSQHHQREANGTQYDQS